LAARAGVAHHARPVSEAELRAADEVWLSSAAREILPVTSLDGAPIGSGVPGPVFRRVYDALQHYKRELSGVPW
jgi:D-alanine transaminase